MVRLGVVSDSHGRDVWLEAFCRRCREAHYDAVVHLGDYEADARWLERHLSMPLICVPGNCDFHSKSAGEALMRYEGHTLLAVHGHRQDVKWRYDLLSYRAEELGADVALFGHTHIADVVWAGRVMLMNPGALMDGRYGELIIDADQKKPYLKNLREEK